MPDKRWKPGQTCRWGEEWATVSYVLPNGRALITTDDGRQALVQCGDLKDPVVRVPSGQDTRRRSP